jgi:putative methionine-R-sulfoxide reductase with GAF domain
MTTIARDYSRVLEQVAHRPKHGSVAECMSRVVDAIWDAMHESSVSWVGFYLDQPGEPDDRRLALGPCRDKPACSPIGLHGVCGQALTSRSTRIVRDVKDLGSNYVACDPHDRSEIVIPLINERGECWSVLDLDSWDVGSFDQADERGLKAVLAAAGL